MKAQIVTRAGAEVEIEIDPLLGTTDVTLSDSGWCHSASVGLTDVEVSELIQALQIVQAAKQRGA
ncbi:hypothetical protein ACQEV9_15520 [Streptomyces chartreusis]|uniref:hypothetical protein n=1 Tax=Streptomyces chartreusis TaxID=1969 RepID=UPI003D8B5634